MYCLFYHTSTGNRKNYYHEFWCWLWGNKIIYHWTMMSYWWHDTGSDVIMSSSNNLTIHVVNHGWPRLTIVHRGLYWHGWFTKVRTWSKNYQILSASHELTMQPQPWLVIWTWSKTYSTLVGNSYHGLTLKAPITTAGDDIYKSFFIVFQRK